MDKNNKNPAIRFKGFTEDWEESTFNDTFSNLSNNTLSRADLNYKSGLAKNIHYGDVLIKYNEILDVQNNVIPFISNNELVDKFKTAKLQNGDIIIADAAEDKTVGKCTEIVNIENEIIFSGLHTIAVRPTFQFAENYLGYYLNAPAYHNQLIKLMQGTKVFSISKSAIKNTVVLHPNDTNEQKQIGSYFQNLDNLISLHQKKYDKLLVLKKAMLVKMFPKNGAVVPEIRFKGFTEDWGKKELKKITSNISDGNWIESNHIFEEGEYRIIQTGNLGLGEYIDKSNNAKYFNQKDFDEVRGNEIFAGDLLISRLAEPAGRTIVLPTTGFRMVTVVDVTIIRSDANSFDSTFLMTQLNSSDILKMVNQNVSGTSHRRISRRNLEKTILKVPNIKEQQKIGSYFKNLDNQIALHKMQLDKLTTIKKACFTKMFVAQD